MNRFQTNYTNPKIIFLLFLSLNAFLSFCQRSPHSITNGVIECRDNNGNIYATKNFNELLYEITPDIKEIHLSLGNSSKSTECLKEVQKSLIKYRDEGRNRARVMANKYCTHKSGWVEYNPGTCDAGGPPPICPVNHWYKNVNSMNMYNQDNNKIYQQRKQEAMTALVNCNDEYKSEMNEKNEMKKEKLASTPKVIQPIQQTNVVTPEKQSNDPIGDYLEKYRKEQAIQDKKNLEDAERQKSEANIQEIQRLKELEGKKVVIGLDDSELSNFNSIGNTNINGELANNISNKSIFDLDKSDILNEEGGGLKDFVAMQNSYEETPISQNTFDANDEKSEMAKDDYNDYKKDNIDEPNTLKKITIKGFGKIVDWGIKATTKEFVKNIDNGIFKSVLGEKKTIGWVVNDDPNTTVMVDKLTQTMPEGQRKLAKQNSKTINGAYNNTSELLTKSEANYYDDEKEIEENTSYQNTRSKDNYSVFTDNRVRTTLGGGAVIGVSGLVLRAAAFEIAAPVIIVGSALKILTSGW